MDVIFTLTFSLSLCQELDECDEGLGESDTLRGLGGPGDCLLF